jgi:hypothetical protein
MLLHLIYKSLFVLPRDGHQKCHSAQALNLFCRALVPFCLNRQMLEEECWGVLEGEKNIVLNELKGLGHKISINK